VRVPVDNHVQAAVDGRFDDGAHLGRFAARMLEIAAAVHAHGSAHDIDTPIIAQPAHRRRVVELRHPLAPEQRHAAQLGHRAMLAFDAALYHAQGRHSSFAFHKAIDANYCGGGVQSPAQRRWRS